MSDAFLVLAVKDILGSLSLIEILPVVFSNRLSIKTGISCAFLSYY